MRKETRTFPMLENGKPYSRWWWFSGPIDRHAIDHQLDWFAKHGFGGVEIAWAYPKAGAKPEDGPRFLDASFQDLVKYTLQGCKDRNIGCDLTFGTLWPFCGTFIPQQYQSKTFRALSDQYVNRSWEARYEKQHARILDHLDKEALDWYAHYLFDRGFRQFAQSYPLAFFCDSWEVEPTDLSYRGFNDDFIKKFGYLYDETAVTDLDQRFDYRHCLSDRILDDFYLPFTEQCHSVGALARVQCHGAPTDILAAYALSDIPESETLLFDPKFSAFAASAAYFAGKPIVSSETFTCIYGWVPSPATPPHMKREKVEDLLCVADAQFAWGINRVVWHGKPFGTLEQPNEFYATVYVGEGGSLEPSTRAFNKYLACTSTYLSKGQTYSNMAILLPLEDQWMKDQLPEHLKKPSSNYWWELQELEMPQHLMQNRPLWFSPHWLEELRYEQATLLYRDKPVGTLYCDSEWMLLSSLKTLVKLAKKGAPIIFARLPKEPGKIKHGEYALYLHQLEKMRLATLQQVRPVLCSNNELDYWCRKDGDTYYLFISHPLMRDLKYPLPYEYAKRVTDVFAQATFYTERQSYSLDLEFKEHGSLLFKISDKSKRVRKIPLPTQWKVRK